MRIALFISLLSIPTWAQDGTVVYQQHCAACHRFGSGTRAPHRFALAQMSRKAILAALETGSMKSQGSELTASERVAVSEFLGAPELSEAQPMSGFCRAGSQPPDDPSTWNGWGVDLSNSRFQPAKSAGLGREQVPKLKLKWAFGFPGATTAFGQPTIVGGSLFLGSADGTVFSLDARTGCIYWTFTASSTVRAAIAVGLDRHTAYFGDVQANVYAVDASNGALLWKTKVEEHPYARITGAPKLYAGRLYVPVSSLEEAPAANPKYECCTFRGSVVALDAASGKPLWKSYTISQAPKPTRRNGAGTQMWGPSGAAVWSSPTLDPEHKALYVGTGDGYSDPSSETSDAVLALDMDSGKISWSQQLLPADSWNLSCVDPDKANCPEKAGPDFDIGASLILRSLSRARRLLLVAQKSGIVHALDPDHEGKIVWQARLGRGGVVGGIEWGGAADDKVVFFPVSDWEDVNPDVGGGLFALKIKNGRRVWYAPPPKPACRDRAGCSAAQPAPATLIPGVVFSGAMDGHLRAYNTRNGKVIWDFDTLREFQTVNGVKARGGSLNATGPTVAAGMLYVNSGYAFVFGLPGNVLLAFSVDGK